MGVWVGVGLGGFFEGLTLRTLASLFTLSNVYLVAHTFRLIVAFCVKCIHVARIVLDANCLSQYFIVNVLFVSVSMRSMSNNAYSCMNNVYFEMSIGSLKTLSFLDWSIQNKNKYAY